jgi:cell division protein FtsA
LRHTAVIPFGGENITNDIKMGLSVLKTQAEQMKVQFGSALANEAKANAYITIPGIRGMAPKEVGVKTLAQIIQARMSEILDFVTYHLKTVGMDAKQLNGGIILTGGGAQLKHLIQLTEYVTGMNARIGYPNEHLAAGHIDELMKPMYSTCIGLILKGYSDYEFNRKQFAENFRPVAVPEELKRELTRNEALAEVEQEKDKETRGAPIVAEKVKKRNGIWKKIQVSLYDLFKEEGEDVSFEK